MAVIVALGHCNADRLVGALVSDAVVCCSWSVLVMVLKNLRVLLMPPMTDRMMWVHVCLLGNGHIVICSNWTFQFKSKLKVNLGKQEFGRVIVQLTS